MTQQPAADGGSGEPHAATEIPMERLTGRPLVLMLDVDGTLAPIVAEPSLARVPDETRRVIAFLVTRPDVKVALVSGRAAHDARRLVGVANLWTIGNHGAEVMTPAGDVQVDPAFVAFEEPMATAARTLAALLAPVRGAIVENKVWTLSVHYRLVDEALIPQLRGTVDDVAARTGLRVSEGKKVLEVRPPVTVHKGTAIQNLASELGALDAGASLFFAGDDTTDEDAFRLLRDCCPNAVTLQVGGRADTAAEFSRSSPDDVRALLEHIAREHTAHP